MTAAGAARGRKPALASGWFRISMQATTCMHKSSPGPRSTHERLLAAAARVFARDGLDGATTREIARAAGVNEVTLFRHFGSRARLLDAVVARNFAAGTGAPAMRAGGSLRADLRAHARAYEERLEANMPLIRAVLGGIHRHGGQERQVYESLFGPLRASLVSRLEQARAAGELRADTDPVLLSDLFSGMIFTGALRRASPSARRNYSATAHLEAAVALILRGAGAT
jgi:AcrR family transcriptional regulator